MLSEFKTIRYQQLINRSFIHYHLHTSQKNIHSEQKMSSSKEPNGNNSLNDKSISDDLNSVNAEENFESTNSQNPNSPLTASNSICTDKMSEAMRNNEKAIELRNENMCLVSELSSANEEKVRLN